MNSPCDLLIKNCTILPMNSKNFIENGSIAVKNSKIAFVGKNPLEAEACKEIDGRGMVALPGLVNCHTHVPMTLFRGVADEKPLRDWLRKSIWPLEAKLKAEDVYLGALLGCLEMIKSGTTCFGDMYFFEDAVARAVEESGLRGVLAEGIIEAENRELGEEMLSASVAFAERFNGKADGRITAMLGPHAAYSCSPELLCRVKEEAARLKVGVHIHLAESEALFRELQRHKASEVEFLDEIGFLDARVVAAHCINLSANDKRILSKRGVNMVYVPVANMKLGLGVAETAALAEAGVNVGLGTDGAASNNVLDMFETIKFASLFQKGFCGNPTVLPAYDVLRMATLDGAKALGLGGQVGSLEVGKKADIILVDFSKPHLKPLHNVYSALVYSAKCNDVDTVIVDGKVLMENRHVKTLDEQAVMAKAEKAAYDLAKR